MEDSKAGEHERARCKLSKAHCCVAALGTRERASCWPRLRHLSAKARAISLADLLWSGLPECVCGMW